MLCRVRDAGSLADQIATLLTIPFGAITAFVDPAVNFALQFLALEDDLPPEENEAPENDGDAEKEEEHEH